MWPTVSRQQDCKTRRRTLPAAVRSALIGLFIAMYRYARAQTDFTSMNIRGRQDIHIKVDKMKYGAEK